MPQMLVAFDLARATPRHIVVTGDPGAADTRALVAEFDRRFLPHDTLLVAGRGKTGEMLARVLPWTETITKQDGPAAAYACVNYACRLPVAEAAAFGAMLDAERPAANQTLENR
jgi:uncharacterized protein YyaL (SSP411 family)